MIVTCSPYLLRLAGALLSLTFQNHASTLVPAKIPFSGIYPVNIENAVNAPNLSCPSTYGILINHRLLPHLPPHDPFDYWWMFIPHKEPLLLCPIYHQSFSLILPLPPCMVC